MKEIIINDDNLDIKDVDKYSLKARALLYKDDSILLANYNGIHLLPGGKLESNENKLEALQRELKEETGILYNIDELTELFVLRYYQKNYLTIDNKILNRLVTTYFYVAKYKGIDLNNTKRTKNEIEGNFKLELIDIDDLSYSKENNNPRKKYFDRELQEVIKVYKKVM